MDLNKPCHLSKVSIPRGDHKTTLLTAPKYSSTVTFDYDGVSVGNTTLIQPGAKINAWFRQLDRMEESRKQKILLLFSRAAHRGENLAVSAQEAVTGGYNPGNMNTGTYCSVLSLELQNETPVDRGPLFP